MPTGLIDCSGWCFWIRNTDGEFLPIRDIQTVTLSIDPDNEENEWEFKPQDFNFQVACKLSHKSRIEVSRRLRRVAKLSRRYVNIMRRLIRTEKRQAEKERRRRLKEGQRGILQERQ